MRPAALSIPIEQVRRGIHLVRGEKVMLDADLALLCGVATGALNRAVKRNADRFPEDFMFQLTPGEAEGLKTPGWHFKWLGRAPAQPAVRIHRAGCCPALRRSDRPARGAGERGRPLQHISVWLRIASDA